MFVSGSPAARVVKFPIMPKKRDFIPTNRIRDIRKAARLTLTQVATALNTTATQIARLETGDRELTLHWMQRLAPILGCIPADMMLPTDGGLDPAERHLVDTVREVPDHGRAAIFSVAESQQPFRHQSEDPAQTLKRA